MSLATQVVQAGGGGPISNEELWDVMQITEGMAAPLSRRMSAALRFPSCPIDMPGPGQGVAGRGRLGTPGAGRGALPGEGPRGRGFGAGSVCGPTFCIARSHCSAQDGQPGDFLLRPGTLIHTDSARAYANLAWTAPEDSGAGNRPHPRQAATRKSPERCPGQPHGDF